MGSLGAQAGICIPLSLCRYGENSIPESSKLRRRSQVYFSMGAAGPVILQIGMEFLLVHEYGPRGPGTGPLRRSIGVVIKASWKFNIFCPTYYPFSVCMRAREPAVRQAPGPAFVLMHA